MGLEWVIYHSKHTTVIYVNSHKNVPGFEVGSRTTNYLLSMPKEHNLVIR